MRKINLRAIPVGKNLDLDVAGKPVGGWHKVYGDLPVFMAFDVDENDKPQFRQLFPDYRCYEIHDALDIARPLCITINPVSWNCQYLYVMKWTAEDTANTQAAMVEYERVRKELSLLLGADPKFVNHVVRSPWYIAGHHRDNPNRTTSKKLIEVGKESLWHYSKWYEPKAYTLAELRELVAQLRELHSFLGNAVPGVALVSVPSPPDKDCLKNASDTPPKTSGQMFPREEQVAYAALSPGQIGDGDRNRYIFSCVSLEHCRPNSYRFKDKAPYIEFGLTYARELNSRLASPLADNEVVEIVTSVVGFCLGKKFGRSSEEARYINKHYRWGLNYVSEIKVLSEREGIFYDTAKKRLQRLSPSPPDKEGDKLWRHCLNCGSEFQAKRRTAKFCSKRCTKANSRRFK
jgi:Replicase family